MTVLLEEDEDKRLDIFRNLRATAASGWDFSSRWHYDENGPYGSDEIIPRSITFLRKIQSHENVSQLADEKQSSLDFDDDAMTVKTDAHRSKCAHDDDIFDEFAQQRLKCENEFNLSKLDTCNVIPVDLNTFLCKVEGYLSEFHEILGDNKGATEYKKRQNTRIHAMLSVLWDDDCNQFRDWNFRYKCFGNMNMASNWIPLWLDTDNKHFNEKRVLLVDSLKKSKLICGGGIVTTLHETDEQWDYPNCWAPLNSMIIEGLYYYSNERRLATKLANIWVNNNYHTFVSSKKMHEKYHCQYYGRGGGGEYKPQTGFGWTNGVCLRLMEVFGRHITLNKCPVV